LSSTSAKKIPVNVEEHLCKNKMNLEHRVYRVKLLLRLLMVAHKSKGKSSTEVPIHRSWHTEPLPSLVRVLSWGLGTEWRGKIQELSRDTSHWALQLWGRDCAAACTLLMFGNKFVRISNGFQRTPIFDTFPPGAPLVHQVLQMLP
jgi:hypothetical protein